MPCHCGNPRDNNEMIETERQRNFEGSPETEPEIEVEEAEKDALAEAFKTGQYKIETFANLLYGRRK